VEQASAGFDGARLSLDSERAGAVTLVGSLTAVSQALRNLLANAFDATAPDGSVRLSVSTQAAELAFSVADDGPGMSESVLGRATEPFFTTKPRGQGMGLGLFLAQSVAEQMGGRLELSSRVGRGTVVTLSLPLTATNGRMVSAAAPEQAVGADG
jgi:two-component system sensor histidine kinase RegB